jgi:hypothetical protein
MAIAVAVPMTVAACGCPAALLAGTLVAAGQELAVAGENGAVTLVRWPWGYGVRAEGDVLVLTNLFGGIEAREGDYVELGGGQVSDDRFGVCGDFEVRAAGP